MVLIVLDIIFRNFLFSFNILYGHLLMSRIAQFFLLFVIFLIDNTYHQVVFTLCATK